MRRLAWVQMFTWLGLFCMWLYFGVGGGPQRLRRTVRSRRSTSRASSGAATASRCTRSSASLVSFALPDGGRSGWAASPPTACACSCGAVGLLSVAFIRDKYVLLLSMVGRGHRLGRDPLDALRHPRPAPCRPSRPASTWASSTSSSSSRRSWPRWSSAGSWRGPHRRQRAGAPAGRRQPARGRGHRRRLPGGGRRALYFRRRARHRRVLDETIAGRSTERRLCARDLTQRRKRGGIGRP